MAHKFQIGQVVEYRPPRGIDAPRGPYLVAALLPERDGEFYHHLRHPGEVHVDRQRQCIRQYLVGRSANVCLCKED